MFSKSRRFIAIVASVVLTGGFFVVPAQGAGPNLVPDPFLRECIAESMMDAGAGAPEEADSITQVDLDALEAASGGEVTFSCGGVSSLEGLQYLSGTSKYDFENYWGDVSDLTPLSGLTTLVKLTLSDQQITDLTPLAGLTNLESLNLSLNQIADLTPLAGLTKLWYLDLDWNNVTDLTPLAGMTDLGVLWLSGSPVTSVAPLFGMADLYLLDLSSTQFSNLAQLPMLTSLIYLFLSGNALTDLNPLSGMTGLGTLDLSMNQISDITPLSGMIHLTDLDLSDNAIIELDALSGMTDMMNLQLSHNAISDLDALSGMTDLWSLGLVDNAITDLTPLSGLTDVGLLYLDDNQITDLTPLGGLNPNVLTATNNQIIDLTPLAGMTDLWGLLLSDNKITDLHPLAGLTELQVVILANNQIVDVTPLSGLPKLEELDLHGNLISDITPIAGWINSHSDSWAGYGWFLSDNRITDVSSLDWGTVGQAWNTVPGYCLITEQSGLCFSIVDQNAQRSAVVGTVPLPQVGPLNSPNPVVWTVVSGDATIDGVAGTITYHSVGTVVLSWTDEFVVQCAQDSMDPPCDGIIDEATVAFFSGTVTITVGGPRPGPGGQTIIVHTGGQVFAPQPIAVALGLALALCGVAVLARLTIRVRRAD